MALVYRSSKTQILKPVHNLGPGSYNLAASNKSKDKNIQQSSVFASSTKRNPFENKNSQNKGKLIQKIEQNETKNQEQNSKCVNSLSPHIIKKYPDCQHVFNSKVQRFPVEKEGDQNEEKTKQILLMEEFKKILLKDINKVHNGKLLKNKQKNEKQNELRGQNYQFFPSIPNWESSFGYRYDSSQTKWVANQNPKIMLQMMQNQKKQQKINFAMGAGYFVAKNKEKNTKSAILKEQRQMSLTESIVYPKLKTQSPVANSIQQSQLRLKAKMRLLGKSPLKKTEQKLSKTHTNLNSQFFNLKQEDKKQHLIFNQMVKKFGQYIPEHERLSPSNYIEKLKETKQKVLRQKVSLENTNKNEQQSADHFLSKSYRFQTKDLDFVNSSSIPETNSSSLNPNSSMILKTHNRKQPLLLGEKRFKQSYQNDPLGPGTYSNESVLQKNKSSPCLNLKQKRFDSQISKNERPGPGDYNVTKNILKKQNNLGNTYSYYKQLQKDEINKNSRRQDSMETLYQSWGRQMNYIAKLDQSSRPQQSQLNQQGKKSQKEQKSLIKVRRQLQQSLKLTQSEKNSQNVDKNQKQNSQFNKEKSSKIYPKITKHLYEYKQLPDDKKIQNMGPGKYQTRPQMIKKTFNVTYE